MPKPQAYRALALFWSRNHRGELNVVLYLCGSPRSIPLFLGLPLAAWHVALFLASFNDTKLLHSRAASALACVLRTQGFPFLTTEATFRVERLRKPRNVKVGSLGTETAVVCSSFFLCDLQTRTWAAVCLDLGRYHENDTHASDLNLLRISLIHVYILSSLSLSVFF